MLSLLLRRNSLNVFERLDFLLYSPVSLRQGVSLARVLSETETDFQQRTPGFIRWRTTTLHLRSYGQGIEIQNAANNSSPQHVGLSRCCDQTTYSYGVQSEPSNGPRRNFFKQKKLTESSNTGTTLANRGPRLVAKVSIVHTSELLLELQNSSDMIIQDIIGTP